MGLWYKKNYAGHLSVNFTLLNTALKRNKEKAFETLILSMGELSLK